jgi:hypothetical protein
MLSLGLNPVIPANCPGIAHSGSPIFLGAFTKAARPVS